MSGLRDDEVASVDSGPDDVPKCVQFYRMLVKQRNERVPRSLLYERFKAHWGSGNRNPSFVIRSGEKLAESVQVLINRGVNINAAGRSERTILHDAAERGLVEFVGILLDRDANVHAADQNGSTPLHISSNERISAMLLDKGANVNSKDENLETPLHRVSDANVAKVLLEHGADVDAANNNRDTALFLANDEAIVEMLLDNGANLHARNLQRSTPLHAAARMSNDNIIKILLDHGADVNAEDVDAMTALYFSSVRAISKMLIDKGADVNARTYQEISPLHWASHLGRIENVEVLLEYGADVDCADTEGRTPLHYAACNNDCDLVELLLKNGAEIEARGCHQLTSLHFAIRCARVSVINSLLRYGANVDDHAVFETRELQIMIEYRSKPHKASLYEEVIATIERHLVSLKALNLVTEEMILKRIDFNAPKTRDFYNVCKSQADRMIREKIGNSRVTFHDVLTKSAHQVASYASNESIVEAIDRGDYKERFSAYRDRIETKFQIGRKRNALLNQGRRVIRTLLGRVLPDFVVEEISSYLRDRDLGNLAKACPNVPRE